MKKLITILIIIFIILAALAVAKNIIAKTVISAGVKKTTGLRLSMDSMKVGIFKTLIDINELKLYNPPKFSDKLMVDMPQIYVNYDLLAFLKKKVHLEEIKLTLKEFTIIKNENGELNLDALKVVQNTKKEAVPEEKSKEKTEMLPLRIDVLELKIDKVIYKDYSKGIPPKTKEFRVNIDERYENITNPQAFVSLIIVKALANTTIAGLADFDLGPLKKGVEETIGKATEIAQETAAKAIDTGKEVGEKAEETVKEAVEETTEAIKKIIPFGKDK